MSIFGGPAWEWDRYRRQYYMTHFLPGMPHLRGQNVEVQDALLDIGRFWLDRGVDGFRLDVINLCMVDSLLRSNPCAAATGLPFAMPGHAQQTIHDASLPENLEFVRRIRRLANEYRGQFLLGEIAGRNALAEAQSYTSGDDLLHSAYHVLGGDSKPLSAATLRRELEGWSFAAGSWPTWSFSNHDVVRGPTRCGGAGAPPAFAQLLLAVLATARGTMLLYQGDELGLPDGDVPFECLRDPATKRFYPDYLQRDGSRTPMPWHAADAQAGFTRGAPWLPLGRHHTVLAVDRQESSDDSTLAWARRLISLRRSEPALRSGDCRFLELPEPLFGFERVLGHRRVACIFNVAGSSTPIAAAAATFGRVRLANGYVAGTQGAASLGPFGFCIIARETG
jgi:alpha-glucosidase